MSISSGKKARALSAIILAVILVLPARWALAADPVVINSGVGRYPLGLHLGILEDRDRRYAVEDVAAGRTDRPFSPAGTQSPSFGFTDSAYWITFTVRHTAREAGDWLLELDYPLMDTIRLYTGNGAGGFTERRFGSLRPFAERDVRHRNPVMKLAPAPGSDTVYYLRFENKDRMEFPLTLWSARAFGDNAYREQFILGLYYGILFIMFAYNLFLFFSVRDRPYLYYVLYILAMGIFQMGQNGLLYQFLAAWRDPPPVHFIPYTQAALITAIYQFSQSYLNTREHAKRLHRVMNFLKYAAAVYFLTPQFLDYTACILIGVSMTFVMIPLIIASGISVMRTGYRPSYYFMAAWSVMFVAGTLFLLRVVAVIPHNTFTNYILHMGTSVEVVLLSLGLGDRFNLIRKEKERIASEMRIARNIQKTLIPREVPRVPGLRVHAEYIPMEDVGGDLYDYHEVGGTNLGVMVADVSGHGVPAALVASMVKVSFSLQSACAAAPRDVIGGMTDILRGELAGTFITAGYAYLDMERRELSFAKRGHLPLYVHREKSGEVLRLSPRGAFISRLPLSDLGEERVALFRGDKLVMFTDGIIECRNREGEIFGFEGLEAFLKENHRLSPGDFSGKLIGTLGEWSRYRDSFDDDITLVVIDID